MVVETFNISLFSTIKLTRINGRWSCAVMVDDDLSAITDCSSITDCFNFIKSCLDHAERVQTELAISGIAAQNPKGNA